MTLMTAARLATTTGQLGIQNVTIPEPTASEVRLRVAYAGICLTDIHFIHGELAAGMPAEVTLGHEVAGTVDRVGNAVTTWQIGDRVLVHPVEESRTSTRVLGVHYDGGWAQYVVAPAQSLVALGPEISLKTAAIIPDAVSTPWAAITETAQVQPTQSVAVWGIGGLGFHAIKLLRIIGAAPIIAIDPVEAARDRALAAGADFALDPRHQDFAAEIRRITDGTGLDVALDFFGSPAIHQQAFDALGRKGRLVLVGVSDTTFSVASAPNLVRNAKKVLGHYGSERRHVEEIVKLAGLGRLDLSESISAVYDLADAHRAVENFIAKVDNPIRILLKA
jgi:2-desacetyl-2-hydroxyethyl bacteriochlorophyllide A dehydrogenase